MFVDSRKLEAIVVVVYQYYVGRGPDQTLSVRVISTMKYELVDRRLPVLCTEWFMRTCSEKYHGHESTTIFVSIL